MWLTGLVAPQHVGSSQTRARTRVPCIGRQILNHCATREAHNPVLLLAGFYLLISTGLRDVECHCCSLELRILACCFCIKHSQNLLMGAYINHLNLSHAHAYALLNKRYRSFLVNTIPLFKKTHIYIMESIYVYYTYITCTLYIHIYVYITLYIITCII